MVKERRSQKSKDIDTAHNLSAHDNERSKGRSSNPWNAEELHDPSPKAKDANLSLVIFFVHLGHLVAKIDSILCTPHEQDRLNIQLCPYMDQVTSCQQGVLAEPQQHCVGFSISLLFHQPAWGFGSHIDEDKEHGGWDEGAGDLESPAVGDD